MNTNNDLVFSKIEKLFPCISGLKSVCTKFDALEKHKITLKIEKIHQCFILGEFSPGEFEILITN